MLSLSLVLTFHIIFRKHLKKKRKKKLYKTLIWWPPTTHFALSFLGYVWRKKQRNWQKRNIITTTGCNSPCNFQQTFEESRSRKRDKTEMLWPPLTNFALWFLGNVWRKKPKKRQNRNGMIVTGARSPWRRWLRETGGRVFFHQV